jgi:hypothetical protein
MKSLHIALVTGCALMFTPAVASKKGTDVYYVNGVWNMSKQVADESRRRLENSLRVHTGFQGVESDPNKLKFFTNYNSSGGYIDDVIAAIAQSTTEIGVVLGQYMLGYIPLSDVIKQPFYAITQKYASETWVSDADIVEHTKRYTTSLKSCKRVLVVPHSQGNLYANRGYELAFKPGALSANFKRSMGISGIASPGVYVAGEVSNYTTSYQDLVINAIRIANPLVLLPNEFTAFNPVTAKDASGHKVVDTYLGNSIPGLRQSVLTAISSVGSRLQDAPNCETSILDLSPAGSDSAALADLINDANNLSPTPVEPGKPLYLEGSGLGGASFVVPGVTARLTASAVNLPVDHPLYVSGAEVWKLTIPASAVVGSSGVIRAIIAIDGLEQSFESPRPIEIRGNLPAIRLVTYRQAHRDQSIMRPEEFANGAMVAMYTAYSLSYLAGPNAGKTYVYEDKANYLQFVYGNQYFYVSVLTNTTLSSSSLPQFFYEIFAGNDPAVANTEPSGARRKEGFIQVNDLPQVQNGSPCSVTPLETMISIGSGYQHFCAPDNLTGVYPCEQTWSPENIDPRFNYENRPLPQRSCSSYDQLINTVRSNGVMQVN